MLKRISLIAALALGSLATIPTLAQAQALTPYVLPLDYELMTEQGRFLAMSGYPKSGISYASKLYRLTIKGFKSP